MQMQLQLSRMIVQLYTCSGVLRTGSSEDRAVLVLSLRAYISRQVHYMNMKVGSKCNATLPTSNDTAWLYRYFY